MREALGAVLGFAGGYGGRKILIPAVVVVTGWALVVGEWAPFWFMVAGVVLVTLKEYEPVDRN